jgi:hypothetical protein
MKNRTLTSGSIENFYLGYCDSVQILYFVDNLLSDVGSKDIEHFWPNNHDIHCIFEMNAIKITHLSLSRGS